MDPKDPNDQGPSRGLKRIYENVTSYQDSSADTQAEIQQRRDMLAKNPQSNDIKEWLAFKLYSAGEYGEAEGFFRDLINNNHRAGIQYFYLGNLLAKTGREQMAVECWRQTIALIPDDVKAKKAAARIEKIQART